MRLTGLTLPILLGALLLQVVTAGTKEGVCPRCVNLCTENLNMACDSDDKCNGTQKCCENGCQYSCKDPAVIKTGKCPINPTPATACPTVIPMKDRHCTGDQDCNGIQKCCKYGCGYSCKNPEVIKSGECPRSKTPDPACPSVILIKDRNCIGDQDCYGTQKCCKDGCGYSCKNPEVMKPGKCPVTPTPATACPSMIPMKDRNCTRDQDCNGTQKCCKDGCGYSCKDPEGTKQGVCPACMKRCSGTLKMVCDSDKKCNGTQKCCQGGCVYSCRNPDVMKPGECPDPQTHCLRPFTGPVCLGDEDCNGTQKCCKEGSNFKCKDPAVMKPGECPIPSIPGNFCHDTIPLKSCQCTGDQNCTGTQKCCLYICQYVCKEPREMKEGECPDPSIPEINCNALNSFGGCESDKICGGKQKCCKEGCRHECRDPVGTPRRYENSAGMRNKG